MRLNGWQRLWILISLAWICAIAAVGYSTKPLGGFSPHHPAYYYQLAPASRASLTASDSESPAVEVKMPNGHVLRFRSDSSRDSQEQIAWEYHELTVTAQRAARSSHIKFYILLAVVPCLILGLGGLGIAWVRKGFSD